MLNICSIFCEIKYAGEQNLEYHITTFQNICIDTKKNYSCIIVFILDSFKKIIIAIFLYYLLFLKNLNWIFKKYIKNLKNVTNVFYNVNI